MTMLEWTADAAGPTLPGSNAVAAAGCSFVRSTVTGPQAGSMHL